MKKILSGIILLGLLVTVGIYFMYNSTDKSEEEPPVATSTDTHVSISREIGQSVENRPIEVYTYGTGDTHISFIGGIHGGYEWNTTLLAYQFIEYFESNPEAIPNAIQISIVPVANPDGIASVVGTSTRFTVSDVPSGTHDIARFNANNVDLNRNFDCQWNSDALWRGESVGAGTHAFSEPEAIALRDFVLQTQPEAVVVWHSAAGAVFGSQCKKGILSETRDIMNIYAEAARYRTQESFDAYPVTGAIEDWLAKVGIPAVSVELTTHDDVEFEKNRLGVQAIIKYYSNKSSNTTADI